MGCTGNLSGKFPAHFQGAKMSAYSCLRGNTHLSNPGQHSQGSPTPKPTPPPKPDPTPVNDAGSLPDRLYNPYPGLLVTFYSSSSD
ncbi:hypothetical protein TWF281_005795 [Arthrobotrys megalospora]